MQSTDRKPQIPWETVQIGLATPINPAVFATEYKLDKFRIGRVIVGEEDFWDELCAALKKVTGLSEGMLMRICIKYRSDLAQLQ